MPVSLSWWLTFSTRPSPQISEVSMVWHWILGIETSQHFSATMESSIIATSRKCTSTSYLFRWIGKASALWKCLSVKTCTACVSTQKRTQKRTRPFSCSLFIHTSWTFSPNLAVSFYQLWGSGGISLWFSCFITEVGKLFPMSVLIIRGCHCDPQLWRQKPGQKQGKLPQKGPAGTQERGGDGG